MFAISVFCVSSYIAFYDIQRHRITHHSLVVLLLLLTIRLHPADIQSTLFGIGLALTCSILCGVGGGDFKLFSVLAITQGEVVMSLQYLQGLLISICISALILICVRRSIQGSIPLAPALLAPFLLGYLAI